MVLVAWYFELFHSVIERSSSNAQFCCCFVNIVFVTMQGLFNQCSFYLLQLRLQVYFRVWSLAQWEWCQAQYEALCG